MAAEPGKPPKKPKEKRQTPEERQKALEYNRMMYGPTAGEVRPTVKKVQHGSAYLQHPKFQSLITAFRKGLAYRFEVTDKGRTYAIATAESQIAFDGKVLYYARPSNRHEDHLLLDRSVAIQYQTTDALVHLVFAVLRSFPELEAPPLTCLNHQFYLGAETLDTDLERQGANLLMGSFKHQRAVEKGKK